MIANRVPTRSYLLMGVHTARFGCNAVQFGTTSNSKEKKESLLPERFRIPSIQAGAASKETRTHLARDGHVDGGKDKDKEAMVDVLKNIGSSNVIAAFCFPVCVQIALQ